jgi:hypothetical protein
MNKSKVLSLAVAIAAAGFAFQAQAQAQNPNTGPGAAGSTANKAGEAYPNDPNAANKDKPTADVVKKAQNSRPAQATKRVTKRAANATKSAGNKAAGAVRSTGENINKRVPPGPNDAKQ